MTVWKKVIHGADCLPCLDCGEPVCPVCSEHYAECGCPGPMMGDEYRYRMAEDGQLWAQSRGEMQ